MPSSIMSSDAITQHNWTGALAVYTISPAQAIVDRPVKGVAHNSKAAGKGAWLKAAHHARIRVLQAHGITCQLELHLQEHLLVRCQLCSSKLHINLLPSTATNSNPVLVLMPKQQLKASTATPICYCFRFYDNHDCSSFKAALKAMQDRQKVADALQRQQQQQQSQLQHQQLAETHMRASVVDNQAGHDDHQQAAAATMVTSDLHAGGTASANAATVVTATAAAPVMADKAAIKQLIRQCLLDPTFQSYIDQLEALWDEVDKEVMQSADAVAGQPEWQPSCFK